MGGKGRLVGVGGRSATYYFPVEVSAGFTDQPYDYIIYCNISQRAGVCSCWRIVAFSLALKKKLYSIAHRVFWAGKRAVIYLNMKREYLLKSFYLLVNGINN